MKRQAIACAAAAALTTTGSTVALAQSEPRATEAASHQGQVGTRDYAACANHLVEEGYALTVIRAAFCAMPATGGPALVPECIAGLTSSGVFWVTATAACTLAI